MIIRGNTGVFNWWVYLLRVQSCPNQPGTMLDNIEQGKMTPKTKTSCLNLNKFEEKQETSWQTICMTQEQQNPVTPIIHKTGEHSHKPIIDFKSGLSMASWTKASKLCSSLVPQLSWVWFHLKKETVSIGDQNKQTKKIIFMISKTFEKTYYGLTR